MMLLPLACFLSLINPPGITFGPNQLQLLVVDQGGCSNEDPAEISLRLYTRYNPRIPQLLELDNDEGLFASHLDIDEDTVVYFEGWNEADDESAQLIKEAYMEKGGSNFLILGPKTKGSSETTWRVANQAAKFLDYLVSRGVNIKKTQLIGGMKGAQIAAATALSIRTGQISRIAQLDTAFPLFDLAIGLHDAAVPSSDGPNQFDREHGGKMDGCNLKVALDYQVVKKCDKNMNPDILYRIYLETNKPQHKLENTINNFISYINSLKLAEQTNENKHKDEKYTEHKQKTVKKNSLEDIKKHKLFKHYKDIKNDEDEVKSKQTDKPVEVKKLEYKTEQYANIYKRDKRVTTIESHSDINSNNKFHIIKHTATEEEDNDHIKAIESDFDETREDDLIDTTKVDDNTEEKVKTDVSTASSDTNEDTELIKHISMTEEDNTYSAVNEDLKANKSGTRKKRFISLFRNNNEDNFLFKILDVVTKNRRILPVVTVMREINTLVKNVNGELNHVSKERNNYIGAIPTLIPITYDLELGNESRATAFVKRLLGFGKQAGKISITGK